MGSLKLYWGVTGPIAVILTLPLAQFDFPTTFGSNLAQSRAAGLTRL
jgi:hypothetical protein